jgi:hypothetical protein
MAAEYKHKKYFRIRGADDTLKTFSSTADANTKIGFTSAYDTSTPTKIEALEDSGQTLVVTYEFESDADQTAFRTAIDDAWANSPHSPFNPADATDTVEHFKTEWLEPDGSVGTTVNL